MWIGSCWASPPMLHSHRHLAHRPRRDRSPSRVELGVELGVELSSNNFTPVLLRICPTFEGGLSITERLDSNVIARSRTHNSPSGNGTLEQQAPPPSPFPIPLFVFLENLNEGRLTSRPSGGSSRPTRSTPPLILLKAERSLRLSNASGCETPKRKQIE
ncbi:hypothetical protein EYF80_047430 [Liparis tanakae]|uniref:Uncharacterized protein n=1 Tax=Liparis tanakae TaxID=230148 RepID=A0A4Z2FMF6_9TELE|nr:hypothetical protein EYF80_047430 [Liparis tanakae]